jgi:hypothetical protein
MMSSYAGAKAAIRAFAQALRAELRIAGSLVRVTTVFPPAVNTPFFSHAISHAKWPARPAPPVYQPEVIAAGLYYAATKGGAEVVITGTASLFGLVVRVAPDLIAWCMTRLGFESQLSRDPEAGRLMSPTLFAPSGRYARRRSFQLAAKQALSTFTRDRTEPPTPPRHVEPEICPAPAHSA